MTGSSIDAIDVAVVRVHGRGLAMRASLAASATLPLGDLGAALRALATGVPATAGEIAELRRRFALLHVEAVRAASRAPLDFVTVHGQNVYHRPPSSWQLLHPAPIAHGLGTAVLSDLRGVDIAAGGQGAPITPLADFVLYRARARVTVVVNLGGFCNITVLPDDDAVERIRAFDVCACNHVLDGVARAALRQPFDADGACAARGASDPGAQADLEQRLAPSPAARRSLGTGDENDAWIAQWIERLAPADLAATACAGVGRTIGRAIAAARADVAIVAGGGVRNPVLLRALRDAAATELRDSDDFGIPAAYREAAGMAVLGALAHDGQPITLAQVTGVDPPRCAGTWTFAGPPPWV